ncbi:MAG: sigma 54-interacting transcriptional regulator [Bacillota bacterium]|nr:sigma 54-interacting transcriptional regulator [Bacillota bacterium]
MAIQASLTSSSSRRLNEMLPVALSLLESIPGGAVLCDPQGTVVGINAACRRVFKQRSRDILGRQMSSLCHDSQWQEIVRTGLPGGTRRVTVDGATLVRVELPVFADGRVLGVLAHFLSRDMGIVREVLQKLPREDGDGEPEAPQKLMMRPQPVRAGAARFGFDDIRGTSKAIREAKALAARAAKTDMPVLIQGDIGTEVEVFAHAIHSAGHRAANELVSVNCRAIPEALLEAELFGLEEARGPGGGRAHPGKLTVANDGTLFLEEISEMPLRVQARLLQVIKAGELSPPPEPIPGVMSLTGDTPAGRIDLRVIASSQQDLAARVGEGRFREDLYYRLNVIRLDIPPLRVRPEDVRVLAEHHLVDLNRLHANKGWHRHLTPDAMETLLRYSWPGNTSELESVLSRAYSLSDGDEISSRHLPLALQQIGKVSSEVVGHKTLDEIVAEVERGVILQALRATGHNKSRTAKMLGLPRSSFYEKLGRYGLLERGG